MAKKQMPDLPPASAHHTMTGVKANTDWHAEFLAALAVTAGRMNAAAEMIGRPYLTVYDHMQAFPDFKAEVKLAVLAHGPKLTPDGTGRMRAEDRSWEPLFLAHLASTANFTKSCELAGVHNRTVKQRRLEYPDFAQAIEDAIEEAKDNIKYEVQKGRSGYDVVEKEVVHPDGTIERHTKHIPGNPILLIFDAKRLVEEYRDRPGVTIVNNTGDVKVTRDEAQEVLADLQSFRATLAQPSAAVPALPAPQDAPLAASDTEWAADADDDGEFPWGNE